MTRWAPSEPDCARDHDIERSLSWVRTFTMAATLIATTASIPFVGTGPVPALIAIAIAITAGTLWFDRRLDGEASLFLGGGGAALTSAWIVASSGGIRSPATVLFVIPVMSMTVRFGSRKLVAGLTLTLACALSACILPHPAQFLANPSPLFFVLVAMASVGALGIATQQIERRQRNRAILDPLTGMLNRSALRARFREVVAQAIRADAPVSVVVCDIDHFKSINDEFGHAEGDRVLAAVAETMRETMRSFDLVYRIGGEEFLALLPGHDEAASGTVAERVRAAIERSSHPNGLRVTVSAGVATARGRDLAYEPLFAAADRALYDAKRSGRNRVKSAGALLPLPFATISPAPAEPSPAAPVA